ncbi:MAG: FliA/WhiG subfamily polymerase sigma-28 subunit [Frankiales bacterium]|nr:FliA/WhiG subfamily polymerase sigma-28 subunit [Frankiales bacterium]
MPATRLSGAARALVEAHLPLVRAVLAGVTAHYPRHADREELAQAASLGLVEAAARFDATRGVPFDRWAALRIRGAIVDAVRALDFAPRVLRSAAREAEAARGALEASLGRTPTVEEVAERLGISATALVAMQGKVHRAFVLSLDAAVGGEDGEPVTLGSALMDEVGLQPEQVLEQRERAGYVRDALACLPERLHAVVVGYFLEGHSSADLARSLGVTESRVSQLRTEALTLLRTGIEAQYGAPTAVPAQPSRTAAYRQAAFSAELATRSSYVTRLSAIPAQRRAPEPVGGLRAAG